MNCPKCGQVNDATAKFCINCGLALNNTSSIFQQTSIEQPTQINQATNLQNPTGFTGQINNSGQQQNQFNQATMMQQSTELNKQAINNNHNSATQKPLKPVNKNKVPVLSLIFISFNVFLKPASTIKEESDKLSQIKPSLILSIIISLVFTVVSLIITMINAVYVKSYNIYTGKYSTDVVWDNLKNIKYFEVIGKYFLIFLGIIVIIAGAYYLVGRLMLKKETNFAKLLGIAAVSIPSALIGITIGYPIISLISSKIGLIVGLVGVIYTFVIIYETINLEFDLKGNLKIYFNLISISLILGLSYILL